MRQFRLLLFLIFVFGSNLGYAQIGNYVIRDSTINLPNVINNTIIGTKAAPGLNNVAYAWYLGAGGKGGSDNTIFGSYAGFNLGTINGVGNSVTSSTIIGSKAGFNIKNDTKSVLYATLIGAYAGYNNGDGIAGGGAGAIIGGTFIGYKAGYGGGVKESIAIGVEAGLSGVPTNSIFIGASSGGLGVASSQCYNDIFIGTRAGYNFGGQDNTLIGNNAGSGSDAQAIGGYENVYVGANSGQLSNSNANTFVGANTGKVNQSARNTFIGNSSGINITGVNSDGNTFLGYSSGQIAGGSSNTFLGYNADGLNSQTFISKSVAIGYNAKVSANNSFILGGTGVDAVNVGIGNTSPNNKLEITTSTANTSGLRFTNLKSTSTPSASNSLGLSVDANGDVILVPASGGGLSNPVTQLTFTNDVNSKINLYQSGADYYGFGLSPGQVNYVTANSPLANHVFYAGGTNNNGIELMRINGTGVVGIGTSGTPGNKLEIKSATANTSGLRFTNLKSTSTPSTANNLSLSVDANGDVILVPAGGTGADVWDQLTNGADYLIRNKNNKSVMIGTVAAAKTNANYKLYVEKGVLSEKFKVSAQANWPDYVFAKDYSLMPLKEVENYITTNNHLPEVPSAEVIAKDGLDLGKMDATLLKKIEELTLYLIEQSKQLSAQQHTILKLQEKISSIEQAKK